MKEETKARLQAKLIDLINHKEDLLDQKKMMSQSLSEQIKGADRRITCLAVTIASGDLQELSRVFDNDELDILVSERLFHRGDEPDEGE